MHVGGRPPSCSDCDAPVWDVSKRLDPLSGLVIGEVNCLRCEGAWLYAEQASSVDGDDDAKNSPRKATPARLRQRKDDAPVGHGQ